MTNLDNSNSSSLHTVFGVISLIIGILGFIFAFVPCLGAYSIYAGGGGLLCGLIAIYMARQANAGIGLAVAGIVMSILAGAIALWQMNTFLS